jgi:hypothetical protein
MVAPEILEMYHRYVPRWFKVIRWRELAERSIKLQTMTWPCFYFPIFYATFVAFNPYPLYLCIKKPQTDEERLALKRDTIVMSTQRDWQMGQYCQEQPPIIDVWKRRQKYPEHYGNKYNGFARDGYVVERNN